MSNLANPTGVPALKSALATEGVKKQMKSLLQENAGNFMMAIVQVVEGTPALQNSTPDSIISCALAAAAFKLPIQKSLGQAYIVPFKDKGVEKAQFIIGYKGLIQLALRTGFYKAISVTDIKKGEMKERNRLTGEIKFEFIQEDEKREKEETIGYASYFKLNNGFESTWYMSKDEMYNYGKKYSSAFKYDLNKGYKNSLWSTDFDSMGLKTVLRRNLSKFGMMSVEMAKAFDADGLNVDKVDIDDNGNNQINGNYEQAEVVDVPNSKEIKIDDSIKKADVEFTAEDIGF